MQEPNAGGALGAAVVPAGDDGDGGAHDRDDGDHAGDGGHDGENDDGTDPQDHDHDGGDDGGDGDHAEHDDPENHDRDDGDGGDGDHDGENEVFPEAPAEPASHTDPENPPALEDAPMDDPKDDGENDGKVASSLSRGKSTVNLGGAMVEAVSSDEDDFPATQVDDFASLAKGDMEESEYDKYTPEDKRLPLHPCPEEKPKKVQIFDQVLDSIRSPRTSGSASLEELEVELARLNKAKTDLSLGFISV